MFLGHFGLALAAKRPAPEVSLGTSVLAAQWPDLLWPALLLVGLERVEVDPGNTVVTPLRFVRYPITHSLLMALVWALLVGGAYRVLSGGRRGAWWLGGLVLSHWVLDFLSHRPDLPLLPGGGFRVGLGLWNSLWGTLAVEIGLFGLGVVTYARETRPRDRIGRWALVGLVFFLLATYVANLLGPPPPGAGAIAVAGLAMWLLVAWAYWIDAHRAVRRRRDGGAG